MPELPEAETIVRGLDPVITGRILAGADVIRPDVLREPPDEFDAGLAGRRIDGVTRRGKNVVFVLDDGQRLVINLGMTGRLLPTADASSPAESNHPAVRLGFRGGGGVVYDDTRRFGCLERRSATAWRRWSRSLGPEPLSRSFTGARLAHDLSRSRTPVRNWLLDQRRVAGVGNIYANEALWLARVHPGAPARSLDDADARRLHRALRRVLRAAVLSRGTTLRDYRDASGEPGAFGSRLRVYGRDGEGCLRCGTAIARIVLTNRSAFFCPRCQRPEADSNAP